MRESAQVVSFPLDVVTTNLLMDFTASPQSRLDEIVHRLSGLAATVFLLKGSVEEDSPLTATALGFLETGVQDCIRIAELRPVASIG